MSKTAEEIKGMVNIGDIDTTGLLASIDALISKWGEELRASRPKPCIEPILTAMDVSRTQELAKCKGELRMLLAHAIEGKFIKNPQS